MFTRDIFIIAFEFEFLTIASAIVKNTSSPFWPKMCNFPVLQYFFQVYIFDSDSLDQYIRTYQRPHSIRWNDIQIRYKSTAVIRLTEKLAREGGPNGGYVLNWRCEGERYGAWIGSLSKKTWQGQCFFFYSIETTVFKLKRKLSNKMVQHKILYCLTWKFKSAYFLCILKRQVAHRVSFWPFNCNSESYFFQIMVQPVNVPVW